MPREIVPFERISSTVEINKIFLIAAEGLKTEYLYLSALNEKHGRICRLLPFQRPKEEASHSAPNRVLAQLKREAGRSNLKEGDSCWLVVDRDSWGQVLIDAVRECKTLQYNPIVSAPCFEIWLVFYFKKLIELNEEEKSQLILNEDASKEIYNIGRGEKVELMDFVDHIENNLDRKAKRKLVEEKPGEAKITWSDCTKLKNLGYKPETSIKEGVEKFITWYKQYYGIN